MKQVYLRITVLFIVFSGIMHTVRANSWKDSLIDKKAAAIQQRLLTRMQENQRLSKEGRDAEANYVVTDDGPEPDYFFKYFTSTRARKFWIDRGWPEDLTYFLDRELDKDGVVEKVQLNNWIRSLRKTYLDKTPYKDYKIYFVISGIYNYKNLNAEEPDYNWSKISTVSFSKTIKDNKNTGDFSAKENAIVNAILDKVAEPIENVQFSNALNKEKFIVFYLFNLYKSTSREAIVSKGTMGMAPEIGFEKLPGLPLAFVISGCSRSSDIPGSLITEFWDYDNAHQIVQNPGTTTGNVVTRSDYFVQMIRNVFTFLSSKGGNGLPTIPCHQDNQLIERLELLYNEPLPNSSVSIAGSLVDLSLATRTCLLEQLSNSTFCGDVNNPLLKINACENLVVDIVASTPADQRKGLLDYLGQDNGVLGKLMENMSDIGVGDAVPITLEALGLDLPLPNLSGKANFSTLVFLLSQYAYDVYPQELVNFHTTYDESPCAWLPYDPTAEKAYSKNIKATYQNDNSILFEFKGMSEEALCSDVVMPKNYVSTPVERVLQPFKFIGIIPEVDLQIKFKIDGQESSYKKEKIIIPALMLFWNINKHLTQSRIDNLTFVIKTIGLARGGPLFSFKKGGSLLKKIEQLAQNGQAINTIQITVLNTPAIKQQILQKEGGEKFLNNLDALNTHLSFAEALASGKMEIGTLKTLCDVVAFWHGEVLKDPLIYTDAKFLLANQPLSDLELGLLNDGIMSRSTSDERRATIDGMFISIRDKQGFQGFRQFCINDPLTTVTLADASWDTQVAGWKDPKVYNISKSRNIARVIYSWGEFLVASGESYNSQMINSKKFIPESFYRELEDDSKRVFTPRTGQRRFDTDVMAMEYFASKHGAVKGETYDLVDEITMYTDLIPCPSCSYVLWQFRQMFPNVKLHIITTNKINY